MATSNRKPPVLRGALAESTLYPVPLRHLVFGIPKMLRPYFRYDRDLLKDLCRVAHECLIEFLRTSLGLPEGVPGIWVHSRFNVYRGRRVLSRERADMERLAQYIIRNPFSVEKMQATEPGPGFGIRIDPLSLRHEQEDREELRGLHPCVFIAAITQRIPDKGFQLVHHYGWYCNKIRGWRAKQADEEAQAEHED